MDKDKQTERFDNLAARVRKEEDQAVAAVNMVNHVTGTQWVGVWSTIDLLTNAIERGGSLTIPSFQRWVPDKVLTAPELLANLSEHLGQLGKNVTALRDALTRNP